MTNPDPSPLKAGALSGQDLSLLKAGSSVLWNPDDREIEIYDGASALRNDRIRTDKSDAPADRFSYLGERGEDGWISAPECGWSENPVPGMMVDVRYDLGGETCRKASEHWLWEHSGGGLNIIAFRPSPALSSQPPEAGDLPGEKADGVGAVLMAAKDAPLWADGIITDGENAACAQRAENDSGEPYWAMDNESGIEWEPTHFIQLEGITHD